MATVERCLLLASLIVIDTDGGMKNCSETWTKKIVRNGTLGNVLSH